MLLLVVIGLVFMFIGAITLRFPPKNINFFYGYRTKSAMKSKERWDFAQTYSSKRMFALGICLMLLSLLVKYFGFSSRLELIIQSVILILSIIYFIIDVELAIKRKFRN